MGKLIGRGVAILGFTFLAVACGSSKKTPSNDPPPDGAGASSSVPPGGSCDPDSRRCEGLNVKVCSANGTEETIAETCLPSQSCSGGVCTDTACIPNTRFCKDGAIWKCDSTGGGSALAQMCAAGMFCRDDDGSASCSNQACTPGQPMCDTNVAATCAADGSGPNPGGTDCAATNQACYQGQCRDIACAGGMKVCQHDDVYLCAQNGTDMSLLADCGMNEVCDGDAGACRPKVCDIGKVSCDDAKAKVQKCNAFGSAWVDGGNDCSADNNICVNGACKKQTCTANATFCQDGNVYQCDPSGVSSSLWQTCTPQYYHCEPYPSSNYAQCAYNQCQPSQVLCDGNVVKTCAANGSLPAAGTDCGNDKYCENGACKPKVCEPFTYYCKNGDVYYCDYFGGPQQGEQPAQFCPTDTTCQVTDNSATCIPLPCSPGETACLGNKVGVCASDGQSIGGVPTDCAANGNVCGTDGKCAKTIIETLGVAEDAVTESAGNVMGDVIQVNSARKVTEMQMQLVLAAPRELRWVIYEQSGTNFIARVDKVVSNVSGTGFISSGPMAYTLKAGKTYLFAVAISGGNSIAYFDTAPYSVNASFGSVLGRLDSGYSSTIGVYFDSFYLYQMKLTTELP